MRYRGVERPVRGQHPTIEEAKEALSAIVSGSLRPEYVMEYHDVLKKVIAEWAPLAAGRKSETHYCSTHKVDGHCSVCGRLEREWLYT
ncbi:MAG: hypothetical protein ACXADB_03780 [Candidatus Hermodarchaeia archaeon]|jgi:hypothetical protein